MRAADRRDRFGRARVAPLRQDPADDLTEYTTAAERLAMVWQLTLEAWSLAGFPLPDYGRSETPLRILPRAPASTTDNGANDRNAD